MDGNVKLDTPDDTVVEITLQMTLAELRALTRKLQPVLEWPVGKLHDELARLLQEIDGRKGLALPPAVRERQDHSA